MIAEFNSSLFLFIIDLNLFLNNKYFFIVRYLLQNFCIITADLFILYKNIFLEYALKDDYYFLDKYILKYD